MVSVGEELQGSALTTLTEGLEVLQIREDITSALQEQHGHMHLELVLSSLIRRTVGLVKRKGKKHQSLNPGQRGGGLRL